MEVQTSLSWPQGIFSDSWAWNASPSGLHSTGFFLLLRSVLKFHLLSLGLFYLKSFLPFPLYLLSVKSPFFLFFFIVPVTIWSKLKRKSVHVLCLIQECQFREKRISSVYNRAWHLIYDWTLASRIPRHLAMGYPHGYWALDMWLVRIASKRKIHTKC